MPIMILASILNLEIIIFRANIGEVDGWGNITLGFFIFLEDFKNEKNIL
jgi:hypothetical protein